MKIIVEHNGKEYIVKEPTIQMWSEVIKLKDIHGEEEMNLRLIEQTTGINREELLKQDAVLIRKIATELNAVLNQENKDLSPVIDFNNRKYKLVNLEKITFGQFVDIDTFLQKDEQYRISNLNELAVYLYTEEGKDYSDKDFKSEIESFKELPVRHIEGALFFFSLLGNTLVELIQVSSKNKLKFRMMKMKILLINIGGGIQRLVLLPKTRFGRLIMLLISPLLVVSTIFLILWTLIKNKKRK
jgi:hypothetical protein